MLKDREGQLVAIGGWNFMLVLGVKLRDVEFRTNVGMFWYNMIVDSFVETFCFFHFLWLEFLLFLYFNGEIDQFKLQDECREQEKYVESPECILFDMDGILLSVYNWMKSSSFIIFVINWGRRDSYENLILHRTRKKAVLTYFLFNCRFAIVLYEG